VASRQRRSCSWLALGVFLKVRRSRTMEPCNLERLLFRRAVEARLKPVSLGVSTLGRVKRMFLGVGAFLRRGSCDGGAVGGGGRDACRDWDLVVRGMMSEVVESRNEAWKLMGICKGCLEALLT
jgi:hypothetical protein